MKIKHMIAAAGLAVAALGMSAGANAQTRHDGGWQHDRGQDSRSRDGYHRDDRGRYDDRRHYGRHDDRGRRYAYGHHVRCHTEWRHHHRIRVCR